MVCGLEVFHLKGSRLLELNSAAQSALLIVLIKDNFGKRSSEKAYQSGLRVFLTLRGSSSLVWAFLCCCSSFCVTP